MGMVWVASFALAVAVEPPKALLYGRRSITALSPFYSSSSTCLLRNTKYRDRVAKANANAKALPGHKEGEEEDFQVLTVLTTKYNDIVIVDTPKSRVLLLDSTHNVHSIVNKGDGQTWTGSYWDEFASLPAVVPEGPIAILGLGGGTSARLMLDLWPSLKLEGWEIDTILIDKAREYLGLSDLENYSQTGGLNVHVGDALSASASVPGGFSGIVVDLFCDGKILPQLQEVTTWLELSNKLMRQGRIMVNCGGAHSDTTDYSNRITHCPSSSSGDLWLHNSTIKAMCKAFQGNLSWKKMEGGENYLALTGPFPDLDMWSAIVPEKLSLNVKQWKPCQILHEDP